MNLLFVCTGNTCRSPMAEGIFRNRIKNDDLLSDIHVSSAGLMTSNGNYASKNAVEVCHEHGVDISSHRSRILTADMLSSTDLFVCMTFSHADILMRANVPKNKIYVLEVSDPYGGDMNIYRQCYEEIEKKLVTLSDLLREHYGNEL